MKPQYTGIITYHFQILLILVAGPDDGDDVDHKYDDLCDVQGGVLEEVHVGEHKIPVDGVRYHDPAPGKRGHVGTLTVDAPPVCQRSNLSEYICNVFFNYYYCYYKQGKYLFHKI